MLIGITVADVMIQSATDRELKDIGYRTDTQLHHRGKALPVLLIIPRLDNLVSFYILLVHDVIGLIIVTHTEVGVEDTFRPFTIQTCPII